MQVPGFILRHTAIKDTKIWHFYVLLAGWTAVYTAMSTSIVLFLNEELGNIFYSGLALSLGCIVSMFCDGFFSALQKIYPSKTLFAWSIGVMIISVLLFLISFHLVFAFIAAIFFSISYDLCDITATTYILEKSLPAEYGQNLSNKQLFQGVGMILGFIISAFLIAASYFLGDTTASLVDGAAKIVNVTTEAKDFISALFLMKIFLLLFLIGLLFFTVILFDKDTDLSKQEILSSFQSLESQTLNGLKNQAINVVKNIPGIMQRQPNQIELVSVKKQKLFDIKEVFEEVKSSTKDLISVFKKRPPNLSLLWSMGTLGVFSYWDTFLGTFLSLYLTEVLRSFSGWIQNVPGSLLLLIFILPVLAFLPLIAKLSDKYGHFYFVSLGIILTFIGCFLLGIGGKSSMSVLFLGGFCISFGYLLAMSPVKAMMAAKMNEFLAVEKNVASIDSNASAAPMMLINNTGNIIGPILGSAMIAVFGFQGFFVLFALFLGVILFLTFRNLEKISGHAYVFQSPLKNIEVQIPVKTLS